MLKSVNHKLDVIERLHDTILEYVGKKDISVDEGFGMLIRVLFGMNTYLSISYTDKINYMAMVAEISYAVKYCDLSPEEIDKMYFRLVDFCFVFDN